MHIYRSSCEVVLFLSDFNQFDFYYYFIIILLTAIGLSPGGSTQSHTIYSTTQIKIHRTTQLEKKRMWKSAGRAPSWRVIPWHLPYNWGKSMEKTSVRVWKTSVRLRKPQSLQNPHTHTHTHTHTPTHTHPHTHTPTHTHIHTHTTHSKQYKTTTVQIKNKQCKVYPNDIATI
jgi:hypothetical protein